MYTYMYFGVMVRNTKNKIQLSRKIFKILHKFTQKLHHRQKEINLHFCSQLSMGHLAAMHKFESEI